MIPDGHLTLESLAQRQAPVAGRPAIPLRAQQGQGRLDAAVLARELERQVGQQVLRSPGRMEPQRRAPPPAAVRLEPAGPEIRQGRGEGVGKGHSREA